MPDRRVIRVNLGHPTEHRSASEQTCLIISPNQLDKLVELYESNDTDFDAVCVSCEQSFPESLQRSAMDILAKDGGRQQAVCIRDPRPILWMSSLVAKRWSVELLESYWKDDIVQVVDQIMTDNAYSSIQLESGLCNDVTGESIITSPRVLFFSPFGSWLVHNQVDAILGTSLRLRGAKVLVVRCDGFFGTNCYVLVHSRNREQDCRNCVSAGDSFFNAFSLPSTQLREYITDDRRGEIEEWAHSLAVEDLPNAYFQDYPVGEATSHHVCSYFRITTRELATYRVVKVHRAMLSNSAIAYEAFSTISKLWRPTQMVMFNGSGFAHGAAYHVGRNLGIPILTHERGFSDDSFLMVDSAICVNPGPQVHVGHEWRKIPLLPTEFARVVEFIENREKGKDLNLLPFYQFQSDQTRVREVLRIPKGAKIVSVFTSSEYETIYWPSFKKVERQLEVIGTLIEIFKDRPEYLVIRHHPAIGGYAGTSPQYDFLERIYEQMANLPPNVRVIMPNEELTSYALLWNSEACITAASTLATEASARGIPAAVMDISPHRLGVAEVMFDLSRSELERIVASLLGRSRQDRCADLKRVLRAVHGMYFRYCNKFSSFGVDPSTYGHVIRVDTVEQLADGCDKTLDRVCRHILFGTSVYDMPGAEELQRDVNGEQELIAQHFEKVERFRELVIANSSSKTESCQIVTFIPGAHYGESVLTRSLATQRLRGSQLRLLPSPIRTVSDIRVAVGQTGAEFVFFPSFDVQYDTSFISTSQDILLNDSSLAGVLWGAWIKGPRGFDCSIFGNTPVADSLAVLKSLGLSAKGGLSLTIFRRSFIVEWINGVSDATDLSELFDHCLGLGSFMRGTIPLAVLHGR